MRFFKRSCVALSTKDLYNQVRLEKEEEYKRKTANEYEYVAKDYGYDHVLPSQYVPSHTIESSVNEIETIANLVEPESDITGASFDEQAYLENLNAKYQQRSKMRKSPTLEKVPEYRDDTEPLHSPATANKAYGRSCQSSPSAQHLNGVDPYVNRKVKQQKRAQHHDVERRDPAPERYTDRILSAMDFSDDDDDDNNLRSPGIRKVPTAFSYHSEDSEVECELERSNSRYELTHGENMAYNRKVNITVNTGARKTGNKSRKYPGYDTGIGEGETDQWRNQPNDRRSALNEYESNLPRGMKSPRVEYEHEQRRKRWNEIHSEEDKYNYYRRNEYDDDESFERHNARRRSRSPYSRDKQSRSQSRERQSDHEFYASQPRQHHQQPPPVDHLPEEISFSSHEKMSRYQSLAMVEMGRKKKTKGFLGMIRDSVMGKKSKRSNKKKSMAPEDVHFQRHLPPTPPPPPIRSAEVPMPYEYGGYGRRSNWGGGDPPAADTIDFPGPESAPQNTYWGETEPRSRTRSPRSPSPLHQHIHRARSPSPSPGNISRRSQPPRSRSPSNDVHRPRTRSRSPAAHDLTRTRSNMSAVPFETTRSSAPQLRFNPDPRRPVPIADAMMKHQYTTSPHNHHHHHYGHSPVGGNRPWDRRDRNGGWSPREQHAQRYY